MEWYQIINATGLSFDIVGIFMLFEYGFPANDYLKNTHWIIKSQIKPEDDEMPKYKKAKRLSAIAKGLLITGLALQLFSIFIPVFNPIENTECYNKEYYCEYYTFCLCQ